MQGDDALGDRSGRDDARDRGRSAGRDRAAERDRVSGRRSREAGANAAAKRRPGFSLQAVLAAIVGVLAAIGRGIAAAVRFVLDKFGLIKTVIGIVVLVIVIVLVSGLVRGCTASQNATTTMTIQAQSSASESSSEASGAESQEQASKPDDGAQVDEDALANLMGADEAAPLIEAAKTNDNVRWIAAHYDQYDEDGLAVEAKLLKLAAADPAAVNYVLFWPDKYPQESGEPLTDSETMVTASTGQSVPRYYQWDTRWGYTVYSSTAFALTGCCPTSLSMVYAGLTGKRDLSPYDLGVIAEQDGYATTYDGTDASFLPGEASRLGLSCTEVGVSSSSLRSALNSGMVCIINVGPGDFTTNGHYIVAVGLDEAGDLIINDPYSDVRSNKTWDIDTVISQTKVIYGYSL